MKSERIDGAREPERAILLFVILKIRTSEDLKSKIIEWNSLDAKIFEKSNETFWEKYKSIPNLSTLENEFGIETGSSIVNQIFKWNFLF